MPINRSIFLVQTVALILALPFWISAQEKSHVTSEQVTHAIQEIEKLAQKQIQENTLPGLAIAVVFQDKTVYAKGFGVRDTNTKVPVDADTVFQLASVSKSIGSTVVAGLVGEKKPGRGVAAWLGCGARVTVPGMCGGCVCGCNGRGR